MPPKKPDKKSPKLGAKNRVDSIQHKDRRKNIPTEELRDFARVLAAGWSPPDPDVLRFYELTAPALLAEDSPIWLYVGYLAGEPVAAAELAEGGGVVGLYNVATLAAHRRRGFGSAVIRRCLLDARAPGYGTAVLQAQGALGLGVYARLGFSAFGEVTEYKP